jgi:hypothetical protein
MKGTLTRKDLLGLWSVLWRLLLFGPILLPLGFALLVIVLGFATLPPFYALIFIINGKVFMGIGVAIVWFILFRLSRRLLRRLTEGVEYAGI